MDTVSIDLFVRAKDAGKEIGAGVPVFSAVRVPGAAGARSLDTELVAQWGALIHLIIDYWVEDDDVWGTVKKATGTGEVFRTGDWIVRGVGGEFSVWSDNLFRVQFVAVA